MLRPASRELTEDMLDALIIGSEDHVVELAPGLGVTTRSVLTRKPASYTRVERDPAAAEHVRRLSPDAGIQCRIGDAENTGLASGSATVVFGGVMLTMQPDPAKTRIVAKQCACSGQAAATLRLSPG